MRRLVAVADRAKNVQVSLKGYLSLDLPSSSPVQYSLYDHSTGLFVCCYPIMEKAIGVVIICLEKAEFDNIGEEQDVES